MKNKITPPHKTQLCKTQLCKTMVVEVDLEISSIEILQQYIEDLTAEIIRANKAIEIKHKAKNTAESFFKNK